MEHVRSRVIQSVDISLITSLYRSSPHLDTYRKGVMRVAEAIQTAGLTLEIILIANEPTEYEQEHVRLTADTLKSAGTAHVVVVKVPRETVYASWNRGFEISRGHCIGPWNVDDRRTAEALIEGHKLISSGCMLVYFPYVVVQTLLMAGVFPVKRRVLYKARPFDRLVFSRAMRGASFWVCARELFEKTGPFDEHFRIAGDFEWATRALSISDFCPGKQYAGEFLLHGKNLSDTGNPLQAVERNIVYLRRGAWEELVPVNPDMMRTCWDDWGNQDIELSEKLQEFLWGTGAFERWQTWLDEQQKKHRRKMMSEAVRKIPRFLINRTGLRPYLARTGIVKSATIDR